MNCENLAAIWNLSENWGDTRWHNNMVFFTYINNFMLNMYYLGHSCSKKKTIGTYNPSFEIRIVNKKRRQKQIGKHVSRVHNLFIKYWNLRSWSHVDILSEEWRTENATCQSLSDQDHSESRRFQESSQLCKKMEVMMC